MPCNGFIQPYFGYKFPAWYPYLNEKKKKENQNFVK